jgi:hypothetical protein
MDLLTSASIAIDGSKFKASTRPILKKGKHASSLRDLLQVEPDTEAGALRTAGTAAFIRS